MQQTEIKMQIKKEKLMTKNRQENKLYVNNILFLVKNIQNIMHQF